MKIIGVGFIATVIAVILKEYRKEYAIYVSLVAGGIIIVMCLDQLKEIISLIMSFSNIVNLNINFIGILLKITAIAILTEFAVSICKDAGENSIASKMDLGGKVLIMGMSVPVISSLLETLLSILPS